MTNQEKLQDVQEQIEKFHKENYTGCRWDAHQQATMKSFRGQEKVLRTNIAKEWEANTTLTNLGDPVPVPQQVLDLILTWFTSGLTRDEHLLLAHEAKDKAHLAAIKLTFDKTEPVLPV